MIRKTYRPYTARELPVGILVKGPDFGEAEVGMIVAKGGGIAMVSRFYGVEALMDVGVEYLFRHYSQSTDGGKTWTTCGMEVVAEKAVKEVERS